MAQQNLWRFYNKWCKNAKRTERILLRDREILEYYSDLMKQGPRKNAMIQFADYIRYLNDFILPADIEVLNWYKTLSAVQENSGIDFGVCECLDVKIRQNMRKICLKTREKDLSTQCCLNIEKYISSLDGCMFESRDNCPARKEYLANHEIILADNGGVLIEK